MHPGVRHWLVVTGGVLAFIAVAVLIGIGIAHSKETRTMIRLRKGDVDTLARTLYGEARGEKRAGMEAVGWVILNRALRGPPRFPGTIAEVCKQRFQFTCWNAGDPNAKLCAAVDEADPYFLLALEVAAAVLGGRVPDVTRKADHYFVTTMKNPPIWATKMIPTVRIGAHSFFRDGALKE